MKKYLLSFLLAFIIGGPSFAYAEDNIDTNVANTKTTIKNSTGIFTGLGSQTVLLPRAHLRRHVS